MLASERVEKYRSSKIPAVVIRSDVEDRKICSSAVSSRLLLAGGASLRGLLSEEIQVRVLGILLAIGGGIGALSTGVGIGAF